MAKTRNGAKHEFQGSEFRVMAKTRNGAKHEFQGSEFRVMAKTRNGAKHEFQGGLGRGSLSRPVKSPPRSPAAAAVRLKPARSPEWR